MLVAMSHVFLDYDNCSLAVFCVLCSGISTLTSVMVAKQGLLNLNQTCLVITKHLDRQDMDS